MRLAAIRSFFAYTVTRDAALAAQAHQVLCIPFKKAPGKLLGYLSEDEIRVILAQPDRTTAQGRRDYLALALLYDWVPRTSLGQMLHMGSVAPKVILCTINRSVAPSPVEGSGYFRQSPAVAVILSRARPALVAAL